MLTGILEITKVSIYFDVGNVKENLLQMKVVGWNIYLSFSFNQTCMHLQCKKKKTTAVVLQGLQGWVFVGPFGVSSRCELHSLKPSSSGQLLAYYCIW